VSFTIRAKFLVIIYSQRFLKSVGKVVRSCCFQKAGAKIGNILIVNKLIYTIPDKKMQKRLHLNFLHQIFKKRTQRYGPTIIRSKLFEKIIVRML
jgi:hypothetical protein